MIEVDEQIEVDAPPVSVWRLLADPHAVVECVPGAAIVGRAEDGSLTTTLSVKFGPMSVAFQAQALLELQPEQLCGSLSARGRDRQGGARFQSSARFKVGDSAGGSCVTIHAEVELSGPLASMIEAGAGVVVKRMSAEFATCLRSRCAALTSQ